MWIIHLTLHVLFSVQLRAPRRPSSPLPPADKRQADSSIYSLPNWSFRSRPAEAHNGPGNEQRHEEQWNRWRVFIVSPLRFEESSSVMLTCKPSADGHFSDNTVYMMVFIITWAHFKGSFTQTDNTFPHFLLSVHAETTISGQSRFIVNSSSSVSIFTA